MMSSFSSHWKNVERHLRSLLTVVGVHEPQRLADVVDALAYRLLVIRQRPLAQVLHALRVDEHVDVAVVVDFDRVMGCERDLQGVAQLVHLLPAQLVAHHRLDQVRLVHVIVYDVRLHGLAWVDR